MLVVFINFFTRRASFHNEVRFGGHAEKQSLRKLGGFGGVIYAHRERLHPLKVEPVLSWHFPLVSGPWARRVIGHGPQTLRTRTAPPSSSSVSSLKKKPINRSHVHGPSGRRSSGFCGNPVGGFFLRVLSTPPSLVRARPHLKRTPQRLKPNPIKAVDDRRVHRIPTAFYCP